MDLVVFGANGPTGRQVVRQALAAGHAVAAVTRRPDAFRMVSARLRIVVADVTDPVAVEGAVSGAHAVISTFGVPYSPHEVTVYSKGIANIVHAMGSNGVQRLVCVSSTAVAADEVPGETLFWRKVLIPFLRNTLGRTVYDDMARMEEIVRRSDVDWTVVRPAGLFDAPEPTADYQVGPPRLVGRYTARADLAQALIREAIAPRHSRAIIEVVTRSAIPSPLTVLAREVFRIGRPSA